MKASCELAAFIRTPASPSSQFMLKVSPKNNGSQHLVAGTEELAPGAAIPKHRHLDQDEIVLIQSGKGHVWLGDQERDLHAGALVFIPANTWVSLKNTGAEPVSLTFIFSAPGFEDTMRCNSVPAGETPTQITPEQQKECAHLGHAENASRDRPKNAQPRQTDAFVNGHANAFPLIQLRERRHQRRLYSPLLDGKSGRCVSDVRNYFSP